MGVTVKLRWVSSLKAEEVNFKSENYFPWNINISYLLEQGAKS